MVIRDIYIIITRTFKVMITRDFDMIIHLLNEVDRYLSLYFIIYTAHLQKHVKNER